MADVILSFRYTASIQTAKDKYRAVYLRLGYTFVPFLLLHKRFVPFFFMRHAGAGKKMLIEKKTKAKWQF